MINAQRRLAVEYYIQNGCRDKTKACRQAGYKDTKGLPVTAHKIFNEPEVVEYVRARIRESISNTEEMTLKWINEVNAIAFSDTTKAIQINENGDVVVTPTDELDNDTRVSIEEISQNITENGGSIKVKMHSKTKGLELLGKYLAILTDVPPEQPGQKDASALTPEERRERILAFQKRLAEK